MHTVKYHGEELEVVSERSDGFLGKIVCKKNYEWGIRIVTFRWFYYTGGSDECVLHVDDVSLTLPDLVEVIGDRLDDMEFYGLLINQERQWPGDGGHRATKTA